MNDYRNFYIVKLFKMVDRWIDWHISMFCNNDIEHAWNDLFTREIIYLWLRTITY